MDYQSNELLTRLLRDVSRSFYLTLRILPPAVRPQIGLAYLLARTSDTIADTELVSLANRLNALQALRARILGESNELPALGELADKQASPAEGVLLKRIPEALALLESSAPEDKKLIRQVLDTITGGQILDLERFGAASLQNIGTLKTAEELDDYTYRVAGCVGEFWTHICRKHVFPSAQLDDKWLLDSGIRFGKGLQLINILRDMPRDLRQGRCYLPATELAVNGIEAADLLKPENELRLRPLYNQYLELANEHLKAGWAYTTALPWGCIRVRLACAWPILIGLRTLRKLAQQRVLDPDHRVKVSRGEVWADVLCSIILYPTPWWSKIVRP